MAALVVGGRRCVSGGCRAPSLYLEQGLLPVGQLARRDPACPGALGAWPGQGHSAQLPAAFPALTAHLRRPTRSSTMSVFLNKGCKYK